MASLVLTVKATVLPGLSRPVPEIKSVPLAVMDVTVGATESTVTARAADGAETKLPT